MIKSHPMAIQTLLAIAFMPLLLSPTVNCYDKKLVQTFCGKLPYPVPCEYFLSRDPKHDPIKLETDFLLVSLELALARAELALAHTYSLGSKCRDSRERAAWEDCVELYEHTIEQLNKSISTKCTKFDKQTWISTALTNLETCKTGFEELGVADYIYPLMSNNVSYLISNTLALNKVPYNEPKYKDGFPKWVKPGDRKLLATASPAASANIVVAKDGSGQYTTVSQAVAAAAKGTGNGRFVIYVKAGIYNEHVQIPKGASNIMLIGDGIGNTIITGSKSVGGGSTSFESATVGVVGDGFMAKWITIRNTAGAENHQAVALRSGSDLSVFYQCSFEGYQDTLYVLSQRQFYRNCDIYGTVDFIFGNAAVVLQNCNIYARYPPANTNTLTAQGRTDPNQNTGIAIHDCYVTAAPDLKPYIGTVNTFLGRPWKAYSRTVFMKTYLDSLINPAGWYPWSGNFALDTLYYAEYANTGPGSSTANRVTWRGVHVITSPTVASQFTVANFIAGDSWLPATGVPYTASL